MSGQQGQAESSRQAGALNETDTERPQLFEEYIRRQQTERQEYRRKHQERQKELNGGVTREIVTHPDWSYYIFRTNDFYAFDNPRYNENDEGSWFCENCFRYAFEEYADKTRVHETKFTLAIRNPDMFCPDCHAWRHTRDNNECIIIDGNVRGLGPITWLVQWVCLKCAMIGIYTLSYLRYSCPFHEYNVYTPEYPSPTATPPTRRRLCNRITEGGMPMVPLMSERECLFLCRICVSGQRYNMNPYSPNEAKRRCTECFQCAQKDNWRVVHRIHAMIYFKQREEKMIEKNGDLLRDIARGAESASFFFELTLQEKIIHNVSLGRAREDEWEEFPSTLS